MLKIAQRICVFALAAAGLGAQTVTPPVPETVTSGIVGIAEGQTAQVNALNPDPATPTAAGACSGRLTFLGDDGTVLKSIIVSVAPGTGAHLTLDSDTDLALAPDARKEIRATIAIPPVPPPSSSATVAAPVCKLIGTLEIFNKIDGRTQVTLGTVHLAPNPVVAPTT